MTEMELLFDPEERNNISLDDMEKFRTKLNKQVSATLFITLIDSLEKKGKIFKATDTDEDDDLIVNFEKA